MTKKKKKIEELRKIRDLKRCFENTSGKRKHRSLVLFKLLNWWFTKDATPPKEIEMNKPG